MFNSGQSPASIFSPDIVRNLQLIHSNRLKNKLYSEPSFPARQLYLLRHTLSGNVRANQRP